MEHKSTEIVMYVIYGYTVWFAAEYLWDWFKKWRNRRRQDSAAVPTCPIDASERNKVAKSNAHDEDQKEVALTAKHATYDAST